MFCFNHACIVTFHFHMCCTGRLNDIKAHCEMVEASAGTNDVMLSTTCVAGEPG